jgi:drug/metabolite transporter (DMT)-like permease
MFELWVPVTLAAAFLQNLRSALQKHLKGRLSTAGATFARFGYGFPVALGYVLLLHYAFDFAIPETNTAFFLWTALGGASQIGATALLVYLFGFRNFAVGTAYSKTETIQAAIFGMVFLSDSLSWPAIFAIIISLVGVMSISLSKSGAGLKNLGTALFERTTVIGLASGALFGISAVAYRGGSLALGDPEAAGNLFLINAGYTLVWATAMQTLAMLIYIRLREPGQLTKIIKAWKVASIVGAAGALGSVGWFTAMTIQNAAYVRALGQIELVFTLIASTVFFHEKSTKGEIFGIVLIVGGILLLLLKG